MSNDPKAQTISIGTERTGTIRSFSDAEEFRLWVKEERKKWDWLAQAKSVDGSLKPLITQQIGNLEHALAVAGTDEGCRESAASLSRNINESKLLLSGSAAGEFIMELSAENTVRAGWALSCILGIPLSQSAIPFESFKGKLRAALFELGLRDTAAAEKKSMESLLVDCAKATDDQTSNGNRVIQQLKDQLIEIQQRREAQDKHFEGILGKTALMSKELYRQTRDEAAARLEEQKKDFDQLKSAFYDFMKLKAPVKYWSDSATSHRNYTVLFATLSLIWGTFIAWYVFSHAQDIFTHSIAANPRAAKGDDIFQIRELVTFLFLVTLAIWLLRILVRITLSNLHQSTDATSRATMTQAYLALIAEKGAMAEQDRILVLTTLFRPMATGLIKDDSMPPSVIELLSRVAGGNK